MTPTVLLFLQDKNLADIYQNFFKRHGLSVTVASTITQLKKALKKKIIKAVLMDEQQEDIIASALPTIWLVETLTPHRIAWSKQYPHVHVIRRQDLTLISLLKIIRSLL